MTNFRHSMTAATRQNRQPGVALITDLGLEELRATLERAPVGIAHVSFNGRWAWVNDRLCSIVGYSREEMLERTFADIVYQDDLASHQAKIAAMLRGEIESFEMDERYLRKDGTLVWGYLTVSFIRDAAENPRRFISVIEDISERKRLERALTERACLLDQAYDAMLARSLDGVILYWNKGAEALYGYPSVEAVGQISHNLFHTAGVTDSEGVEPGSIDGASSGTEIIAAQMEALALAGRWEGELAHTTRDGRQIVVESRQNVVEDGEGHAVVLEANRDVTERKRLEGEQAHIRNIIGHEMGTPLTTLKARMQLLRRQVEREADDGNGALSPRVAEHLNAMQRAMGQVERQLNDLRTVVHVTQADLTIEREPCDLPDLCRDVVEEHRLISGHSIDLALPATPVWVLGDSGRLHQVLANLLSNALKYSPKDRLVDVTVDPETDTGYATVAVRDGGPGIPPDALTHIFDQFYRVPGIQARSGGGGSAGNMGLGLFIAKAIVEQHGGTISVTSQVGHGSTFRVSLPVVPPPGETQSA